MGEVEVFIYEWTYWDGRTDAYEPSHSKVKVTREEFERRAANGQGKDYRLIEHSGSKELVPESAIVDGVFHPGLHR